MSAVCVCVCAVKLTGGKETIKVFTSRLILELLQAANWMEAGLLMVVMYFFPLLEALNESVQTTGGLT